MIKKMYNANFEIDTPHLNKTIKEFKEVAYSQEVKGINKYGKPLDPMDNYNWLQMALEEQVDGAKYLIAEMEKRKFIVKKIRTLLEYKPYDFTEIYHWLDVLEGK